jgi:hypothetical protein
VGSFANPETTGTRAKSPVSLKGQVLEILILEVFEATSRRMTTLKPSLPRSKAALSWAVPNGMKRFGGETSAEHHSHGSIWRFCYHAQLDRFTQAHWHRLYCLDGIQERTIDMWSMAFFSLSTKMLFMDR